MVDLTVFLQAMLTLLATIITVFIIPWLKSKAKNEQLQNIRQWAIELVEAAEVLIKGTKLGQRKKEFVMKKLMEICEQSGYTFSEQQLEVIIESTWEALLSETEKVDE